MPQARDEAGNIWETDAQGNPVRLIQAAQSQMTVGNPNPYAMPKAAADVASTQVNTQGQAIDNAVKSATAQDLIIKAQADARAAVANAAKAEADAKAAQDAGKPVDVATLRAARAEALQRLELVRSLGERSNDWFATGFGSNIAAMIPGTTATDVKADIGTLSGSGALEKVIEMAKQNGGKNPLTPLSEGDFKVIRDSVTNLDPTQSDANFRKNLGVYDSIYGRALQNLDAQLAAAGAPVPASQGGMDPLGNFTGETQYGATTGQRYSTQKDIALARVVEAAYHRKGSTAEDLFAAARSQGYEPTIRDVQAWRNAVDYRNRTGKFTQVLPRQSGERSEIGGAIDRAVGATTPVGAASMGLANAFTMGGLDEIVGGINTLGNNRSLADNIAWANMGKQVSANEQPGAYLGGQLFGGLAQGAGFSKLFPALAGALTKPGAAYAGGTGYGAVSGALESNDSRLAGTIAGGITGAGGTLVGRRVIAPLADKAMRSEPGQRLSGAFREAAQGLPERFRPAPLQPTIPQFARGENLIPQLDPASPVMANLRDAERFGLPYSLSDADPRLRALGGVASRLSPDARELAERTFEQRARDQADRAYEAIDQNLAPVTDLGARRGQWRQAAQTASAPYYASAGAMPAPDDPRVAAMLQTPLGKRALKQAYEIARHEGRDPTELGFILDDAGEVGLVPQDGRYRRTTMPQERDQLTRRTVGGYGGRQVPKAGPIDLVGWLRMRGGLRDQSGELGHMGLSNAPRRGMDFVGRESEFGPLVNQDGATLDDAAMAAWEAGYFPELADRPDVNTFINALRDTYEGRQRRFLPEDFAEIDAFNQSRDARFAMQQQRFANGGQSPYEDFSVPAGPDAPIAPLDAYGKEVKLPSFETLDLVKRGIDAELAPFRNPLTGKLDLEGNPAVGAIEKFRQRYISTLDELNPDYRAARVAYQGEIQNRNALDAGEAAFNPNVRPRQLPGILRGYDERQTGEFQRGFGTAMADRVNNARLSANPYDAVYGTTAQQAKVGDVFPQGAANFGRIYDLERDMGKTFTETLGGSQTAPRLAADEAFQGRGSDLADAGIQLATTGMVSPIAAARAIGGNFGRGLADRWRIRGGQKKADALAPILFNTDTPALNAYLSELAARQAQDAARKGAFKRRGGLFGATVAVPALAAFNQ
jgi:hypothetical protein